MDKRVIIVGAGPAGLGAGYELSKLGHKNFMIYEKKTFPGGISTSYKDSKGFIWDVGGHVLFSHYSYFDNIIKDLYNDNALNSIVRSAYVFLDGNFIPYPFQYNIRYLSREKVAKIVDELFQKTTKEIKNFEDWLEASFGRELSEIFMFPYNYKVWAYPPSKMGYQWVGERVATVDLRRLLKNIITEKDDIGWGPNARFIFPKNNGTGDIFNRIANTVSENIVYNKEIVTISGHNIFFRDGKEERFDYLISTMPINHLIDRVIDAPVELKKKSRRLLYNQVHVFGIGIKGELPQRLKDICWMYFPQRDVPFYRLTVFTNYSKNNAPDGHYSLMVEVSESTEKRIVNDVGGKIVNILKDIGFVSGEIVDIWHHVESQAYPIPSVDRDDILQELRAFLEKRNILSRGRLGGWQYEVGNMDHSFMQGVESARRIVLNETEVTLFNPSHVNANIFKRR